MTLAGNTGLPQDYSRREVRSRAAAFAPCSPRLLHFVGCASGGEASGCVCSWWLW